MHWATDLLPVPHDGEEWTEHLLQLTADPLPVRRHDGTVRWQGCSYGAGGSYGDGGSYGVPSELASAPLLRDD